MRRISVARLVSLAALATMAAACSSGPGTGGPAATTGTTPGSTNTSTANVGTKPAVDLTFTGTLAVTAKGSAGTCQLGRHADGSLASFGFNATDADYPGLGENLNFTEDSGSHRMNMKWAVGAGLGWVGEMDTGVTISADHRSVTFDADLPKSNKPEHVKGTIACP
jgi:hypothetical protein